MTIQQRLQRITDALSILSENQHRWNVPEDIIRHLTDADKVLHEIFEVPRHSITGETRLIRNDLLKQTDRYVVQQVLPLVRYLHSRGIISNYEFTFYAKYFKIKK